MTDHKKAPSPSLVHVEDMNKRREVAVKLSGHWPKHMDQTEAKIINKLITAILKDPHYVISVHDGEEIALKKSRDRAAIQAEVAATDVTNFIIYEDMRYQEGGDVTVPFERIGTITMIHGNGEDVLSDGSWPRDKPEHESTITNLMDSATPE